MIYHHDVNLWLPLSPLSLPRGLGEGVSKTRNSSYIELILISYDFHVFKLETHPRWY